MKNLQRGFLIPVVALIVAVLAVGAGVGYFKNKEKTDKPSGVEKNAEINLGDSGVKLAPKNVPGWNTFISEGGTFSISYPKNLGPTCANDMGTEFCDNGDWKYWEGSGCVSFGTETSRIGGFIWGICAYNKEGYDLEGAIKTIGNQFDDRKEKREKINIDGRLATIVTVTTADYPDWNGTVVIVENVNKIYWIGGDESSEFETFYKSFQTK